MAIKQRKGEDFSDEKIEKVKELLAKGETKVVCCNVLGIKYNTTRLAKIIAEYEDKLDLQAKMRKSLRNKPLEKQEIKNICQSYLDGEPLSEISKDSYRTTTVIKNVLRQYGIPLRNASNNYYNPVYIDDETPEDYVKGDLVFSAKYNTVAEIMGKISDGVFRICVLGEHQRYACQPYYELADLRRVQDELGITGTWQKETRERAWQAVVDAQKKKKEVK